MSAGENFHVFRGFSLDRNSFPINYRLVDQQYKSTELLQQTLSEVSSIFLTMMMIFQQRFHC